MATKKGIIDFSNVNDNNNLFPRELDNYVANSSNYSSSLEKRKAYSEENGLTYTIDQNSFDFIQNQKVKGGYLRELLENNKELVKGREGSDALNSLFNSIGESDDPVALQYDLLAAEAFSKNLGIPIQTAYQNLDQLLEAQFGQRVTRGATAPKAIWVSFHIGGLTVERGTKGAALMLLKPGTEEYEKALNELREIDKQIEDRSDFLPRSFLTEIAKAGAQTTAYTLATAAPGIAAGLTATAIGGPVVGTIATVIGSIGQWGIGATIEGGNLYYDLINKGIDNNVARVSSIAHGAISATIETGLGNISTSLMRGAGVTTHSLTSAITGRIIRSGVFEKAGSKLMKALALYGTHYVADVISEGVEEFWQSISESAFTNLAYTLDEKEIEYSIGDIFSNAGESFIEGVKGSMILGLFGASSDVKADKKAAITLADKATKTLSKEKFMEDAMKIDHEGITDEDWSKVAEDQWENQTELRKKRATGLDTVFDAIRNEAPITSGDIYNPVTGEKYELGEGEYRNNDGELYLFEDANPNEDGVHTVRVVNPSAVGYSETGFNALNYETNQNQKKNTLTNKNSYAIQELGNIQYKVNQKGDIEIVSVNFKDKVTSLKKEALQQFLKDNAGTNILWNNAISSDKDLKETLIAENPRGLSAGLNYSSSLNGDEDISFVKKWIGSHFSSDKRANSVLAAAFQAMAKRYGETGKSFIEKNFGQIKVVDDAFLEAKREELIGKGLEGKELEETLSRYKSANAFISPGALEGAKAVIYAGKNANPTSFMHEMTHFLATFDDNRNRFEEVFNKVKDTNQFKEFIKKNRDIFGTIGDINSIIESLDSLFNGEGQRAWTEGEHEFFSRLFEAYIKNGRTLNNSMKSFMHQLSNLFRKVYNALRGEFGADLNEEVKEYFDDLWGFSESSEFTKDNQNVQESDLLQNREAQKNFEEVLLSEPIRTNLEIPFLDGEKPTKEIKNTVLKWALENIRGEYFTKDGQKVRVTRQSINELIHHDTGVNDGMLQYKSLAFLPQIINNMQFICSALNSDTKIDTKKFDYYISKVAIDGEEYIVRSVIATLRRDGTYYDHHLTKKEDLQQGYLITSQGRPNGLQLKDKRLQQIIQDLYNSSQTSDLMQSGKTYKEKINELRTKYSKIISNKEEWKGKSTRAFLESNKNEITQLLKEYPKVDIGDGVLMLEGMVSEDFPFFKEYLTAQICKELLYGKVILLPRFVGRFIRNIFDVELNNGSFADGLAALINGDRYIEFKLCGWNNLIQNLNESLLYSDNAIVAIEGIRKGLDGKELIKKLTKRLSSVKHEMEDKFVIVLDLDNNRVIKKEGLQEPHLVSPVESIPIGGHEQSNALTSTIKYQNNSNSVNERVLNLMNQLSTVDKNALINKEQYESVNPTNILFQDSYQAQKEKIREKYSKVVTNPKEWKGKQVRDFFKEYKPQITEMLKEYPKVDMNGVLMLEGMRKADMPFKKELITAQISKKLLHSNIILLPRFAQNLIRETFSIELSKGSFSDGLAALAYDDKYVEFKLCGWKNLGHNIRDGLGNNSNIIIVAVNDYDTNLSNDFLLRSLNKRLNNEKIQLNENELIIIDLNNERLIKTKGSQMEPSIISPVNVSPGVGLMLDKAPTVIKEYIGKLQIVNKEKNEFIGPTKMEPSQAPSHQNVSDGFMLNGSEKNQMLVHNSNLVRTDLIVNNWQKTINNELCNELREVDPYEILSFADYSRANKADILFQDRYLEKGHVTYPTRFLSNKSSKYRNFVTFTDNVTITDHVMFQTDVNPNLEKEIDNITSEDIGKPNQTIRFTNNTPYIFQRLGMMDLPVEMFVDKLARGLFLDSTNQHGHKEGIDKSIIKQVASQFADPVFVFKSATKPNSLVSVYQVRDKNGKPIIVSLKATILKGSNKIEINRITSIYGKPKTTLQNWIDKGLLLYVDDTKKEEALTVRHQLPSGGTSSTNNVLSKTEIVNKYKTTNQLLNSVNTEINDLFQSNLNPNLEKEISTLSEKDIGVIDKTIVFSEHTPNVFMALGLRDLSVEMYIDKAARCLFLSNVKEHGHKDSINKELLLKVINDIANPMAIFDSATVKNSFVALYDFEDLNGKLIMLSLTPDKEKSNKVIVNLVSSVYGRNNEAIYSKWINSNLLRYFDDTKESTLTVRLQLPSTKVLYTDKVLTKTEIVNKLSEMQKIKSLIKDGYPVSSRGTSFISSSVIEDKRLLSLLQGSTILDDAQNALTNKRFKEKIESEVTTLFQASYEELLENAAMCSSFEEFQRFLEFFYNSSEDYSNYSEDELREIFSESRSTEINEDDSNIDISLEDEEPFDYDEDLDAEDPDAYSNKDTVYTSNVFEEEGPVEDEFAKVVETFNIAQGVFSKEDPKEYSLKNPNYKIKSDLQKDKAFLALLDKKSGMIEFLSSLRNALEKYNYYDKNWNEIGSAEEEELFSNLSQLNMLLDKNNGAAPFIYNLVHEVTNRHKLSSGNYAEQDLNKLSNSSYKIAYGIIKNNPRDYRHLYALAMSEDKDISSFWQNSEFDSEREIIQKYTGSYSSMSFKDKQQFQEEIKDERLKKAFIAGEKISDEELRNAIARTEEREKLYRELENASKEALQNEIVVKNKTITMKNSEIMDVQKELDTVKEKSIAINKKLVEETNKATLKLKKASLTEEELKLISSLRKEKQRLQKLQDSLNEKLAKAENADSDLTNNVKEDLEDYRKLEKYEKNVKELENKLKALREESQKNVENYISLSQIEKLEKKVKEMQRNLDNDRSKSNRADLKRIESRAKRRYGNNTYKDTLVRDLKYNQRQNRINELKEKINDLKSNKVLSSEEAIALLKEVNEKEQKLQKAIYEEKRKEDKAKLSEANKEVSKLENELERINRTLVDKVNNKVVKVNQEALEAEINKINRKIKKETERLENRKKFYNQAESSSKEEAKKAINATESKLAALNESLEELLNTKEKIKDTYFSSLRTLTKLEEELSNTKALIESEKEKLSEGKGKGEKLEKFTNKYNELSKRIDALKENKTIGIKEADKALSNLASLTERIKANERIDALKEVYRERVAYEKLKAEKLRLSKIIMREPSKNVNIEEADKIIAIQATLEPSFAKRVKVDGTFYSIDSLREAMKDESNILLSFIKPSQWEKILKKNLNDLTLNELEALADTVTELRKQGLRKRNEYKAAENAKKHRIASEFIQIIAKNKGLHNPEVYDSQEEKKKGNTSKGKARDLFYETINMARKAQILDGGKKGDFYEFLITKKREIQHKERKAIEKRTEPIIKLKEELDIKDSDLYKTYTISFRDKEATFTLGELAYVYLSINNEKNKDAVAFGTLVSTSEKVEIERSVRDSVAPWLNESEINQEVNNAIRVVGEGRYFEFYDQAKFVLESQENKNILQFIKALENDLNSDSFDRLRELILKVDNLRVEREEYYLPISRSGEIFGEQVVNYTDAKRLIMEQLPQSKGSLEKGFTKERIVISPKHQSKIELDLFKLWSESVEDQEHLFANYEYLKELNGVFKESFSDDSKYLREQIELSYGKKMMRDIDTHIQEIASPSLRNEKKGIDKALKLLTGNLYSAYLGFRLSSVLNQAITSPYPFMSKVTPFEYLGAIMECIKNPRKFIEKIYSISPFMKSRTFDLIPGEIKDARKEVATTKKEKILKGYSTVLDIGMSGLEWIDKYTVAIGWYALYQKELKALGTVTSETIEEARKKTDEFVIETQPQSDTTELSPLFKNRNQALQMLTRFTASLNVPFQDIFFDTFYRDLGKKHDIKGAIGKITGMALAGILLGLLHGDVDGKDKDDKESGAQLIKELIFSSTTQLTEGLPLVSNDVGKLLKQAITGEKEMNFSSPVYPALEKSMKTGQYLLDKNWNKAIDNFFQTAELSLGLPYSTIKDLSRAFENGAEGFVDSKWLELIGYRTK